ncbi:MAG TPA: hypothetical protein VGI12_12660 [Vicinamibacterales bacterium]|jgi:hypothetical protein
MGIDSNTLRFLSLAQQYRVNFARTLMIGRQRLYVAPEGAPAYLRDAVGSGPYAEEVFRFLGADVIDSLDRSNYEGATILHDLGTPLPEGILARYSLVFDAGTLEHVFNFPQALRNCMELVAADGHLITCSGVNNFCGHGFYQFSPELFFRALSPDNGFQVVRMIACDARDRAAWFEVADPMSIGGRVELVGPYQVMLMVLARRVSMVTPFLTMPQQSDYVSASNTGDHPDHWTAAPARLTVRDLLPKTLISALRRRRSVAQYRHPGFKRLPFE